MIGTYPFSDYEGFKEIFVREDGRRKNAVLLNCLKHRAYREWCIHNGSASMLAIRDMSTLKTWLLDRMARTRKNRYEDVRLMDHWFCSPLYYLDGREGLCEDRDYRAIRYCRRDDGRVYKMKAGRFFRHLIGETHIGDVLPESAILWMCEEFQRDWETYARAKLPPVDSLELHVDDNFDKIYDGRHLLGNFGSCMVDEDRAEFYTNSVDAKAAYLTNVDNKIVARCIIFTHVEDCDTGEILRLAERQYSSEGQEIFKRDLITALIQGGHIDGYKRIGAGCSESTAFVSNSGESWSHRRFQIRCELTEDDTLSYQDSFKFYNIDNEIAYNSDDFDFDCRLDTTSRYMEGSNYDEYHEERVWCEVTSVYANGRWMTCADDNLGDFEYISGEGYIHTNYISYCPRCGEAFISDSYYFSHLDFYESEVTDEMYCSEYCMERDEEEYKESNWYYSDYDHEYYEDEGDVTTYKRGDDDEISISVESGDNLVEEGEAVKIDDVYVNLEYLRDLLSL